MDLRHANTYGTLVLCWRAPFRLVFSRGQQGIGHTVDHRRRILVLDNEELFTAAISSLLATHSEFDVETTPASTLVSMCMAKGKQPDVVILEEKMLAANIADLVKLTKSHPNLRLIVIGLNNANVHVFDKQVVQVGEVSDFLRLL